jgi:hypothetical protein
MRRFGVAHSLRGIPPPLTEYQPVTHLNAIFNLEILASHGLRWNTFDAVEFYPYTALIPGLKLRHTRECVWIPMGWSAT